MPIVAEEAVITKRTVPGERVRVRTVAESQDVTIREMLRTEAIEVARRPVERRVDAAPPPREEGDTLIVSLVEERAVVTKQLFVVEEIILRRTVSSEPVAVPVTLRRMRAVIERDGAEPHPENGE